MALSDWIEAAGDPVNKIDPLGLTTDALYLSTVGAISLVGVIITAIAIKDFVLPSEISDSTLPPYLMNEINNADKIGDTINDKCKTKKCKPCTPPVDTIGTDVHIVPPKKPHKPIVGSHIHWYKMNQAPYPNCRCFWKRNIKKPTPGNMTPSGTVPVKPAAGGGPM